MFNGSQKNRQIQNDSFLSLLLLIRYILSLSQAFKQYRIKNIWLPPGIELRTACLNHHKCSAAELRQPASKKMLQFCIYTVKGYCYATVSLSADK